MDSTPVNEGTNQRRSRIVFVGLVAVVVVPIVIAYILFFNVPSIIPSGTTNEGVLISPPLDARSISPALLESEGWLLLQPVETDCNQECEQILYLSRQVISGLGKNKVRVHRVLMTETPISDDFASLISSEHRDASVIVTGHERLDTITRVRPVLFLMDPNGNIMMYYSLDKAGKPMLKDLKHLLKISNIG